VAGNRDFGGASGAVYRYLHLEHERMTPLGAGNFLYVREDEGRPVVVFAGEAERLTASIGERWREAVELHGATHMFARRNVSSKIRQEELADLVAAHTPVMNRPDVA
jgi:hypothetical protein